MQVTIVNGTSGNVCKCGDWLSHWKKFSGQPVPQYCSELGCSSNELVGAHVQKHGSSDQGPYIIPLCKNHNASEGATFSVGDHLKLVSANVSRTCGK